MCTIVDKYSEIVIQLDSKESSFRWFRIGKRRNTEKNLRNGK